MPGPPNRPPEKTPEAPLPPVVPESAQQKSLRRLVPSRVALLLDPWKGAPNPDLMVPFDKAEAAYQAGDYSAALSALDQLSIRFAEPRWPTLPDPFRLLRVSIPAPMPPHWDPNYGLSPAEKEVIRARRVANEQLTLAGACVAWAAAHQVASDDLARPIEEAKTLLATEGESVGFYDRIDAVWNALRERVPRPKNSAVRAPPPPAAAAEAEEA
jgi:hypothetical protein